MYDTRESSCVAYRKWALLWRVKIWTDKTLSVKFSNFEIKKHYYSGLCIDADGPSVQMAPADDVHSSNFVKNA